MGQEHTTAAAQRYLLELAGDSPTEPVVRALLERAVGRLDLLCKTLLFRSVLRGQGRIGQQESKNEMNEEADHPGGVPGTPLNRPLMTHVRPPRG
jgi:hypothetical protein